MKLHIPSLIAGLLFGALSLLVMGQSRPAPTQAGRYQLVSLQGALYENDTATGTVKRIALEHREPAAGANALMDLGQPF